MCVQTRLINITYLLTYFILPLSLYLSVCLSLSISLSHIIASRYNNAKTYRKHIDVVYFVTITKLYTASHFFHCSGQPKLFKIGLPTLQGRGVSQTRRKHSNVD